MSTRGRITTAACLLLPFAASAAQPGGRMPGVAELRRMTARFAPTEVTADVSRLPPAERKALAHVVEAARVLDPLYLRQVWPGNPALLLQLLRDSSPVGRARLHAFLLHKGPWSRIDHDRAFIPGVPAKPEGAGFYPADATKAEIERWLQTLEGAEKERAAGFFTVIRRTPDGGLAAVPYSVAYQGELQLAADLLREAARLTAQPTLRRYLETRAAAFLSNDYYASDVAWMELDASIEPTLGPYEVYEDNWFNYKAAFEAFVALRDDAETEKLAKFSGELQGLEDELPIDPALRNPRLGALAPIRVVNSIFSSGDANRGVQTAAFNLPNDERVAKEKGTKRVMLKNVQQAKFRKVLVPISRVALAPKDRKNVSFDAFFTHILMHELMHGLGPHHVQGKPDVTVRQALQEAGSAIEEAKADISGLWALQRLVDKGVIDKRLEATMYTTFLASAFRSIRFGVNEAHGRGIALQLNWLLDRGAVKVAPDGTFAVVDGRIREAVTDLTRELMTLQASGDAEKARAWLDRMAVVRPPVQKVLDRLRDVPVDIEPIYAAADALRAELAVEPPAAAGGR